MIPPRKLPLLYIMALSLVLLLAVTPSAAAKGAFAKVIVYGAGLAVESSDPSLMRFDAFNGFSNAYPGTPSVTDEGYLIVRYAQDQRTGEYLAVDSLRLWPTSLSSGSIPFVYYEGLVNGWSEYDHKWYEAKPEAARAVQQILESEADPSSRPSIASPVALVLSGLAGIAIGVTVMTILRPSRPDENRSRAAAAQQVAGADPASDLD
jgi:hypothetical protein